MVSRIHVISKDESEKAEIPQGKYGLKMLDSLDRNDVLELTTLMKQPIQEIIDVPLSPPDEIIQDFKNKNITRETILRQERILSRMLDNQKSLTQKDFSNKRKSKSGARFDYEGVQSLPENLGDRTLLLINAMEAAMDEGFSNEYNKIIRNYFVDLQQDNEE